MNTLQDQEPVRSIDVHFDILKPTCMICLLWILYALAIKITTNFSENSRENFGMLFCLNSYNYRCTACQSHRLHWQSERREFITCSCCSDS